MKFMNDLKNAFGVQSGGDLTLEEKTLDDITKLNALEDSIKTNLKGKLKEYITAFNSNNPKEMIKVKKELYANTALTDEIIQELNKAFGDQIALVAVKKGATGYEADMRFLFLGGRHKPKAKGGKKSAAAPKVQTTKVFVLGRERVARKEGRKWVITYNKKEMSLSDARAQEKKLAAATKKPAAKKRVAKKKPVA